MKIAIGSDHIGFPLKQHMIEYLKDKGHEVIDFGTDGTTRVDYPLFGRKVANVVANGEVDKGVLICGNRGGHIHLCQQSSWHPRRCMQRAYSAKLARQHNNANIVAFGARVIGEATAEMIVDEFFAAEYEDGRHQKRIDIISEIEKEGK